MYELGGGLWRVYAQTDVFLKNWKTLKNNMCGALEVITYLEESFLYFWVEHSDVQESMLSSGNKALIFLIYVHN